MLTIMPLRRLKKKFMRVRLKQISTIYKPYETREYMTTRLVPSVQNLPLKIQLSVLVLNKADIIIIIISLKINLFWPGYS
jgi:hypothetical protein